MYTQIMLAGNLILDRKERSRERAKKTLRQIFSCWKGHDEREDRVNCYWARIKRAFLI